MQGPLSTTATPCRAGRAGDTFAPARGAHLFYCAVVLLLSLHAGLALSSTAQRSVTTDELFHITGGYLFNKYGDFRIHPENGILTQRLQGLPAVFMNPNPPPMQDNEYWRTSDTTVVSYQFFYESGNDHWPMLMAARAVNVMFSVGLCTLVFAWARALAGNVAGLVALGMAAFSPTLLAHGPLATSDAASALALTASAGAFWWQLQQRSARRTLLSAAVFAVACVSKYSAVLLIPVFAILIVVHALRCQPGERRPGATALSLAVHAAMAWAAIWATCGFRFAAFSPDVPPAAHFILPWGHMLARVGWQGHVIDWLRDIRFLPEAFLYGYTHTYAGSLARAAFLAGEYSSYGWRSFFPLAFLWKSTPAELAAAAMLVALAIVRLRRALPWLVKLTPLLVLVAVYGAAAIASHLNIGHRHILPLYPALFIATGVAVARLKYRRFFAAPLLGAQLLSSALIFPYYIAYFNTAAGGPAHGWRLLVDSSLDWGQDLPGFAEWERRNNPGPGPQPVFLSYFGSGEPDYYRIPGHRMLTSNISKLPLRWYEPTGGIYAISATLLQHVYSPLRGAWTLEFEREYQDLRRFEQQFRDLQESPRVRAQLLAAAPADQWLRAWHRYELLRHARLCAYLRARGPDDMVGYSILIFRLTDDEVDAVLRGPYSEWHAAIETVVAEKRR